MSWQSKSDEGCFIKGSNFPGDVTTNDLVLMRHATDDETKRGVEVNEKCLIHLTVVNLIALSTHWDFLLDHFDD